MTSRITRKTMLVFTSTIAPLNVFYFFFSSRRRHTRCLSDWSSDVCSSDLYRARIFFCLKVKKSSITSQHTQRNEHHRSEERRVGKECRYRRWPEHYKKKTRKRQSVARAERQT